LGNGCKSDDEMGDASGVTGGRRGKTLGAAAVDSEESSGVIFGGNRRIDGTGGREGRTI
jgi:citrate lyase alpha subunit